MSMFRIIYSTAYEIEAETVDEALDKVDNAYETDSWLEEIEILEED